MYEEHKRFMAWAGDYDTLAPPQRCKTLHEEWLMKLNCPVLRLDGTRPVQDLVLQVSDYLAV
jgi:hypothetical protein